MEFTKAEAKDWAKTNLKGLEAVLFPSFTPDLQNWMRKISGMTCSILRTMDLSPHSAP